MTASRAVVLLSGGLDSATVLAIARADGHACHALSVDYGQRHQAELAAAARVAAALGAVAHEVVRLDLTTFGGSALTDAAIAVPTGGVQPDAIPITYVPARNTILLALALAWAEVLGAQHLFFGANAVDYSGYPDCRPEYVAAFEALASLATARGVQGERFRIHAPLQHLTKAQIIRRGIELGLDYGLTHSCYDPGPDGRPCGRCDSCVLRAAGFAEVGAVDPVAGSRSTQRR